MISFFENFLKFANSQSLDDCKTKHVLIFSSDRYRTVPKWRLKIVKDSSSFVIDSFDLTLWSLSYYFIDYFLGRGQGIEYLKSFLINISEIVID